MTEESSSPGGWTQIGHLIGAPGTIWVRPLATPGEIENCVQCGRHARECRFDKGLDLTHMRAVHDMHTLHTLPATGPGEVPPTQRSQSRQE